MFERINDASATPAERLAALGEHVATGPSWPGWVDEANNHIHTIYSFSPYAPAGAALRGREAGLPVVGSVDHDSLAAAGELRAACALLGMGAVTGFELRTWLTSDADLGAGRAPFADRKLNSPDAAGMAYLTVQGIPERARDKVAAFLDPIRQARRRRTLAMASRANEVLTWLGLPTFDPEADMMARSQFANGGTVTERHLLAAMARSLIAGFGTGPSLVAGITRQLQVPLAPAAAATLGEADNPHLIYDLLGVLKSEYLPQIYLEPTDEMVTAETLFTFAGSIDAIGCYAYLGDITASPTGDKKAEKFEDEFLDELFDHLDELGCRAVTYMPPRNTPAQLARIRSLAERHGMLQVSGVDINQSRQAFNCPELQRPEFAPLNEATWAVVAHEYLAEHDPALAFLSSANPYRDLAARTAAYAEAGHRLVAGAPVAEVAAGLTRPSLPSR